MCIYENAIIFCAFLSVIEHVGWIAIQPMLGFMFKKYGYLVPLKKETILTWKQNSLKIKT